MTQSPVVQEEFLEIFGAREHNLKNIDLKIPRNKVVVITGLSGSGKSSLAFDTIYAEGQRRYMESFSAYARSFLGGMERPDVDKINGLSPVIAIEQKTTSKKIERVIQRDLVSWKKRAFHGGYKLKSYFDVLFSSNTIDTRNVKPQNCGLGQRCGVGRYDSGVRNRKRN